MTKILEYKEKLVAFYNQFEDIIRIVGKFVLALLLFNYINTQLGYFESLTGVLPTLFLSVVSAAVPVPVFVLIAAAVVLLHLFRLSLVLAAGALVVFLLFYFIYLKFAPEHGILIILYPVLSQFNLQYMVPLIGAMAYNPLTAIPIAFAVVFMKFLQYLQEAADMTGSGLDIEAIVGSYQYVFDHLFADKAMVTYIVVFTLTILVVYAISRFTFDYAWYVAFAAGTAVNVVGFAIGASSAEGINLAMAILGSILGGLLMALVQFMDCVVDYTKKEYLQFEDDEYFYYVKAIPKIQVSRSERNVKTFKPGSFFGGNGEKKPKTKIRGKKAEEIRKEPEDTVVQDTQDQMLSDFDELSFDGFDFDETDNK